MSQGQYSEWHLPCQKKDFRSGGGAKMECVCTQQSFQFSIFSLPRPSHGKLCKWF